MPQNIFDDKLLSHNELKYCLHLLNVWILIQATI